MNYGGWHGAKQVKPPSVALTSHVGNSLSPCYPICNPALFNASEKPVEVGLNT